MEGKKESIRDIECVDCKKIFDCKGHPPTVKNCLFKEKRESTVKITK